MKAEFKKQLTVTVVIVLVFNVLNTLFRHWIFFQCRTLHLRSDLDHPSCEAQRHPSGKGPVY